MSHSGPSTLAARSTRSDSKATPSDVFAALEHGNVLRGGRNPPACEIVEAGRPDQDRDAAGNRPVEAGLQPGRRREIDEHVAMILVDREAGIFGDCGGDRAAHPAVRSEKADADRLLVSAHGAH